ncbi:hypothetical protein E7Z59_06880 [Robertkochia marina]|uniref:Uncharacterized protein n=1 Tax=Robertkochia marina TaxID=1227945 RepID=A0A4S3LZ42_9FLAO|nr:hypothetical protein [Robertkochia marina]THD67380.1 hypothetical protein E7Z59_06880 [Robertkochia marina]TRZ43034.1 hypothetical protein D3A96_11185 [Robertkochia marina]
MKTINVKYLFTVLLCTGLVLSCSNDDDAIVADDPQTPNPRVATPTSEVTSVSLNFAVSLDTYTDSSTCGDGNYFYQHSGEGSNGTFGDYSITLTYCGQPNSFNAYDLEVVIQDSNGDQITLSQAADSFIPEPVVNGVNQSPNDITDADGNSIHDADLLVLEVTHGTGSYSNAQGEFSTQLRQGLNVGAQNAAFAFSGRLTGL